MSNTKIQNLPFATDEECLELRRRLVASGKLVPDKGLPRPMGHSPEPDFTPAPPRGRRNAHDIPEEGVYKCSRIKGDGEYERRRRNYFVVLQEILRSREPDECVSDSGQEQSRN
jgi:hypothetical protein